MIERLRAALAQPTPEPSLRDEQEANSAAWHESIRRAQAAKEADTPEPSLRDALAGALRTTEWWLHCHSQTQNEWTSGELADVIIAALPGLSLSAQPALRGALVGPLQSAYHFARQIKRWQHQPGIKFGDEADRIERRVGECLTALGLPLSEPVEVRTPESFAALSAQPSEPGETS